MTKEISDHRRSLDRRIRKCCVEHRSERSFNLDVIGFNMDYNSFVYILHNLFLCIYICTRILSSA